MGIFIPNMKFLCLTLSLGEVCTDDTDTNNDDASDDTQRTKHDCLINQMSHKAGKGNATEISV